VIFLKSSATRQPFYFNKKILPQLSLRQGKS